MQRKQSAVQRRPRSAPGQKRSLVTYSDVLCRSSLDDRFTADNLGSVLVCLGPELIPLTDCPAGQ